MSSSEMTICDVSSEMIVSRPPEQVLAEAKNAAMALADVVSKKKRPVMMNGEQYLEFEDWQTVGRFYGLTAKVISTSFIDLSGVQGFEARAVAMRGDGMEVSAAESMCLNDEPKWKTKPFFQLRSMAQTRACAKALRNVLAWVVVLAGYRATPAEEIQDMAAAAMSKPDSHPTIRPPTAHDGFQTVNAVIEKTSQKDGKTGSRMWTLYGIQAGGIWYNTFDDKLHNLAVAKIGKEVEIIYQVGGKGNSLTHIKVEGCTESPHTCDLSTFVDGKAACEGGQACVFLGKDAF